MKVIITGTTGMIGKGVLLECLESDSVEEVLIVNRSSVNMEHTKLKEVLHKDFTKLAGIKNELSGYDACFFCLGISSIGMDEAAYTKITYNITEAFATTLHSLNPNMVFNYVSGAGTDSTEKGSSMWARVKGKTENMIFNMGFKDAYAFRIGTVFPVKGVKSKTGWINILLTIFYPILWLINKISPMVKSSTVGLAMINSVLHPQVKKHLENKDVLALAGKV